MLIIRTPDRAEKLAAWWEKMGYRVDRLYRGRVIEQQRHGDLLISTALYARAWKGKRLQFNITYQWIDGKSALL